MSCSYDNTIKIWCYERYELLNTLSNHENYVIALAYIQNTKLILSGGFDK